MWIFQMALRNVKRSIRSGALEDQISLLFATRQIFERSGGHVEPETPTRELSKVAHEQPVALERKQPSLTSENRSECEVRPDVELAIDHSVIRIAVVHALLEDNLIMMIVKEIGERDIRSFQQRIFRAEALHPFRPDARRILRDCPSQDRRGRGRSS